MPRLVLRFAIYAAIALAIAASGILWFIRRDAAEEAQERVAFEAQLIAETVLQEGLRPSDLHAPVSGARLAELDALFASSVLTGGNIRAKLWSAENVVTYSNDHSFIGEPGDHAELEEVLEGEIEREVGYIQTAAGGEKTKVLEAFVPVRLGQGSNTAGALELYRDYEVVADETRKEFVPIAAALLFALLVLYVSLFPILRRVTASLQNRNRSLAEQARVLEAARQEAEEARRDLAVQNERLLELDHLKDEFVALVSHELRTPLTSIRGYIELLLEEGAVDLTDDQSRFLAVIGRNAERLERLVSDLLFVAQIEADRLEIEQNEFDLCTTAANAVEAAMPLAEQRGIALDLEADELPPLLGDRSRVGQLLDNLISNALKFTHVGGRVNVRVGGAGGRAVIEVSDTGVGISPEEQERLFERFFRSEGARAGAVQGTGLGLSIVKGIVEAHGGTIAIQSEQGVGTTFRVELPLAPSARDAGEARTAAAPAL